MSRATHHEAARVAALVEQTRQGDRERPAEQRVFDLACCRRGGLGCVEVDLRQPSAQIRSDQVDDWQIDQRLPHHADPLGEGAVDVREPELPVADRDEIRDRVEGVLQLPPRVDDVLQELHVLDGTREVTAELTGGQGDILGAPAVRTHAFEHDRSERAPPST